MTKANSEFAFTHSWNLGKLLKPKLAVSVCHFQASCKISEKMFIDLQEESEDLESVLKENSIARFQTRL